MKLGKKNKVNRPATNSMGRAITVFFIIAVTAALIIYVQTLGKKAEETIPVVMFNEPIFKNDVITEDKLVEYDMLIAEYEKYSIVDDNGKSKRRIVTWDEKDKLLGLFAAYSLQENTVGMYRDFVKSRLDNSDTVLYSFPGKNILPLDTDGNSVEAFKTFLQPGDRLDIQAVYSEKIKEEQIQYGNPVSVDVEVFKSEALFKDIVMADLLNGASESVLDLYNKYKSLDIWSQASLDSDPSWQASTTPKTLLVALTPEEMERYYYFTSKNNVKFKVSMPQRDSQ